MCVPPQIKVPGLDVGSFVNGSLPIIGMAHSGGGYRAMLNGAGVFAGIDERTPQSINGNQTSGLAGTRQLEIDAKLTTIQFISSAFKPEALFSSSLTSVVSLADLGSFRR